MEDQNYISYVINSCRYHLRYIYFIVRTKIESVSDDTDVAYTSLIYYTDSFFKRFNDWKLKRFLKKMGLISSTIEIKEDIKNDFSSK